MNLKLGSVGRGAVVIEPRVDPFAVLVETGVNAVRNGFGLLLLVPRKELILHE
jgi:hypothetical protein